MADLPMLQRSQVVQTAPMVQRPQMSTSLMWEQAARAAGQLNDVLDKEKAAAEAQYMATLQNDVEAQAVELRHQFEHNPEGFSEKWNTFTAEKIGSIPGLYSEKARMIFDETHTKVRDTLLGEARSRGRALAGDAINARFQNVQNEILAEARQYGPDSENFKAKFAEATGLIGTAVNLGMKSKEAAAIELDDLRDAAKGESVLGSVESIYSTEGEEAAFKYLEQLRDPSLNFSPQAREALINRGSSLVEARASKDKAIITAANAEATAQLDLGIEKAVIDENTMELDRLYAEAEKSSYLTPAQRTDRLVKIMNGQKEISGSATGASLVQANLAGVPLLDPTNSDHIKAVDKYFTKTFMPMISSQPVDQQVQSTMDFVRKTNVVPTAVKSQLVGGLASGSPEIKVQMAQQISNIVDGAPFAQRAFDERTLSKARYLASMTAGGMSDPVEAVRQVEESDKVPETVINMRKQRAKVEKHADSNKDFLTKRSAPWLSSNINVPENLMGEFTEIQSAIFQRTGDLESSQKAAWDSVTKVWGVSEIGMGGKRWQKYAPESYGITQGQGNTEWMRKQLMGDILKDNMFTPETTEDLPNRIMIEADPQTASEAGAGMMPSWMVLMRDDNGVLQPLYDANGGVARWRPDFSKSPEYAELVKQHEELNLRDLSAARKSYLERKQRDQETRSLLIEGAGL